MSRPRLKYVKNKAVFFPQNRGRKYTFTFASRLSLMAGWKMASLLLRDWPLVASNDNSSTRKHFSTKIQEWAWRDIKDHLSLSISFLSYRRGNSYPWKIRNLSMVAKAGLEAKSSIFHLVHLLPLPSTYLKATFPYILQLRDKQNSFKKLKIELPYDPPIPLLGIYLEKRKMQFKKIHTPQCS